MRSAAACRLRALALRGLDGGAVRRHWPRNGAIAHGCLSRELRLMRHLALPRSVILPSGAASSVNQQFLDALQKAQRLATHHLLLNEPPSSEQPPKGAQSEEQLRKGQAASADGKDGAKQAASEQQNKKEEPISGDANRSGRESRQDPEDDPNNSWMGQAALALFVMLGLSLLGSRDQGREISFQAFVWDLLEPGLVDRIEVVNRNVARVYLRTSATVRSQDVGVEAKGMRSRDRSMDDYRSTPDPWGSDDADFSDGSPRRNSDKINPSTATMNTTESPFYFTIGSIETFEKKLEAVQEDLGLEPDGFVPVMYTKESSIATELLRQAPSILLLAVGIMVLRNALGQLGGMGGSRSGIFQVGKANPTVVKGSETGPKAVTFAHVAGLDEAKLEVMEFVDFLKNPSRYERLGAKIPKGALLVGPPGTGKTLLAKATAGEANVPFFSMSGSDFIEMFVGVGPSRVRDLFSQARSSAPCIIFIDEIDAIGKARGRGGLAGGNDERENTLNALLVEMDGFTSSSGVVVLAGTNRADVLDKALLRPGRFDRQISIDKPDMRGRYQIFMVHLQPLKLNVEASTIAKRLAALTPGFAGADIANICNEAALIAARADKDCVEMVDFERATDRVIGGLEKKNKVISRKEREIVAHHEAGHAIAGWFLQHADPLIKVSIIPRGSAALGFAQYLPTDKFLQSKEQLRDFMVVALGGRVAEQLCFGSITTGAQDDLKRITRAVYAQITNFGMSEKVGKVYFPRAGESGNQFYKPYSEKTAQLIDDEAVRIVDEAYRDCEKLLSDRLDMVKALAARLLEKEVIGEDDLTDILGDRPYAKPATYDEIIGRYEKDRRDRTRQGEGGDDGIARDGSTTPPIPVEGAEGEVAGKDFKRGGRATPTGDVIPELA
ncbi:ATP-dependent zinc metalloprotease FTSH 2 [Gracilaria domingensis]|nr:ATP-dependent zinc metalloprotease FTSH 2 [Gracilaria domingensis]